VTPTVRERLAAGQGPDFGGIRSGGTILDDD